jgi:hypothetical protein
VAGRFPIYTDADIRGVIVDGLIDLGWDVVRAIDCFPKGTADIVHFEEALRQGRVLVANDEDQAIIGDKWYKAGRHFLGVVYWRQKHYRKYSNREILDFFEWLATQDDPFAGYPIIHLKKLSG